MQRISVFLDTNIFKFSAVALPRLRPREVETSWGAKKQRITVHDLLILNPNEQLSEEHAVLKAEAALLPEVAALAAAGLAVFHISDESVWELSGLPNLDSQMGQFYGAKTEIVFSPVRYSRIVCGGGEDVRQAQYKFLCSLTDKRFLELQKITGAYQGERAIQRNQLLDAFHLWCAEYNKCDFFLSLDFKLANHTKGRAPVPIVLPSKLLAAVL
jgi:hypothetical protein